MNIYKFIHSKRNKKRKYRTKKYIFYRKISAECDFECLSALELPHVRIALGIYNNSPQNYM